MVVTWECGQGMREFISDKSGMNMLQVLCNVVIAVVTKVVV